MSYQPTPLEEKLDFIGWRSFDTWEGKTSAMFLWMQQATQEITTLQKAYLDQREYIESLEARLIEKELL